MKFPFIININFIKFKMVWEFPGSPVVSTQCFNSRGPSSIPGQGTKILKDMWHGQKKKNFYASKDILKRVENNTQNGKKYLQIIDLKMNLHPEYVLKMFTLIPKPDRLQDNYKYEWLS